MKEDLKLKFLMIGDFLYNALIKKYFKISPDWFLQYIKSDKEWLNQTFKLVLLTDELLEKNNFLLNRDINDFSSETIVKEKIWYFEDKEKQIKVEIKKQSNKDFNNYIVRGIKGTNFVNIKINKLHELQHIFNLFEYQKEWIV